MCTDFQENLDFLSIWCGMTLLHCHREVMICGMRIMTSVQNLGKCSACRDTSSLLEMLP